MDADTMLKPHPYQEDAITFLFERDRALVLASVGAGKTLIALRTMQELLDAGQVKRWLVLAPKRVAVEVWPKERVKWAPKLSMSVAVGTPKQREAALYADTDVVVLNYDNIQKLPADVKFDGVIFDELTKLKNPSGARFKALLPLLEKANIRYGLTGSFTSNGLEDVFGQCKVVDQNLLGRSKGAFLQQYFICMNRDFQDWMPRPKALENIMAKIKPATFLLESKEYKDTLPPLHIVEMRCDLPDRAPYETMKKHLVVEFPDAKVVAANAAVVTGKLAQGAAGFFYESTSTPNPNKPGKFITTKRSVWMSRHKFEVLDEILEENQRAPTLVFYNFQEELAELYRRYPHLQTLDDKNAVDRWNAGKIELLAAHPKSAQFGLNLQDGGNKIVWLSLPWSLTDFEQANGRLHRQGQRHDVWCYQIIANDTIDEKILAALRDKQDLSTLALEALK